ncbi:MAG: hypothetical protein ACOWYE_16385 [Desulfatiglandales bacterium]
MDGYSGLGGPSGIPPSAGSVWAVQKKQKTDDRRQRKERGRDDEKEEVERHAGDTAERDKAKAGLDTAEDIGYGSAQSTAKRSRNIDLVI